MAWMTSDLAWGVALYSRETLNQPINFVAQNFAPCGTVNLSVSDHGIGVLPNGGFVDGTVHLVVGSLSTIGAIVNALYGNGH